MSETIYVGKGKASKYGVRFSICVDDLPMEHMTKAANGKRYINLEIKEMKQPDKWGKTHTVTVDTWKPETQMEAPAADQPKQTDDLPF
jgi:hypothetical protein